MASCISHFIWLAACKGKNILYILPVSNFLFQLPNLTITGNDVLLYDDRADKLYRIDF